MVGADGENLEHLEPLDRRKRLFHDRRKIIFVRK
jgi:hypothetical protein